MTERWNGGMTEKHPKSLKTEPQNSRKPPKILKDRMAENHLILLKTELYILSLHFKGGVGESEKKVRVWEAPPSVK